MAIGQRPYIYVLASSGLLLLVFLFVVFASKEKYDLRAAPDLLSDLPTFSSIDFFGEEISSSDMLGRLSLVLFIDPRSDEQVLVLQRATKDLNQDEVNILIFLEEENDQIFDIFMEEIEVALGSIILVTDNYKKYKKLFKNLPCCEPYFFFNEKGELTSYGINRNLLDVGNLKSFFYTNGSPKNIEVIKAGVSIDENELIKPLKYILVKERGYDKFLFSMFNGICTGCRSFEIFNRIRKATRTFDSVYSVVILSSEFSSNDVNNLKSRFNVECSVINADLELCEVWEHLSAEYGRDELNNIVFLADRAGKVLRVLNKDDPDDFFLSLKEY